MTYPIKGVPVTLHEKVSAGKDAFNHEIFEETDIVIDNVLIAPLSQSGEEILTEINLTGKKARYQLAIPKTDTHNWEDVEVSFFGQRWRSIGFSTMGIDGLIPLGWNRKVVVERYG